MLWEYSVQTPALGCVMFPRAPGWLTAVTPELTQERASSLYSLSDLSLPLVLGILESTGGHTWRYTRTHNTRGTGRTLPKSACRQTGPDFKQLPLLTVREWQVFSRNHTCSAKLWPSSYESRVWVNILPMLGSSSQSHLSTFGTRQWPALLS